MGLFGRFRSNSSSSASISGPEPTQHSGDGVISRERVSEFRDADGNSYTGKLKQSRDGGITFKPDTATRKKYDMGREVSFGDLKKRLGKDWSADIHGKRYSDDGQGGTKLDGKTPRQEYTGKEPYMRGGANDPNTWSKGQTTRNDSGRTPQKPLGSSPSQSYMRGGVNDRSQYDKDGKRLSDKQIAKNRYEAKHPCEQQKSPTDGVEGQPGGGDGGGGGTNPTGFNGTMVAVFRVEVSWGSGVVNFYGKPITVQNGIITNIGKEQQVQQSISIGPCNV